MEVVNAVAKVRFGSAKAQRVALCRGQRLAGEIVCLEAGQTLAPPPGERVVYVVTGAAEAALAGKTLSLPTGQMLATSPEESPILTATGDRRAVLLVISPAD